MREKEREISLKFDLWFLTFCDSSNLFKSDLGYNFRTLVLIILCSLKLYEIVSMMLYVLIAIIFRIKGLPIVHHIVNVVIGRVWE